MNTESSLHIMQANIGMGLNHQDKVIQSLQSFGAFFLAQNPDFFRKHAEVQSYIEYIKKENPDVLYLTEVCGIEQRDMLVDALEKAGYRVHFEEGFELWNMQSESHRFLYHIMGSRYDYIHRETFTQYRNDAVPRYLKSKNYFSRPGFTTSDVVRAILDGSGSHYSIGDVEIGLLHSHADFSKEVPVSLISALGQNASSEQILIGDVNMSPLSMEQIIADNHSPLERIETKRTYPYVLEKNTGVFGKAIQRIAQKAVLPYPDQVYITPTLRVENLRNLGPKETGLTTDHSVNHYIVKPISQSSR